MPKIVTTSHAESITKLTTAFTTNYCKGLIRYSLNIDSIGLLRLLKNPNRIARKTEFLFSNIDHLCIVNWTKTRKTETMKNISNVARPWTNECLIKITFD